MLVEQQAAIEVRTGIDGPRAAVGGLAAVKERASVIVDRFEFDPDVERIDRAAREEVADLSRADHDFDADRIASPDRRVDLAERRDHFGRRREEVLRRAEVHRLLADRERAGRARLG